MSGRNRQPGEDLARILINRYRTMSGERVTLNKRFRTIVVVGAGASKASCDLPLAPQLAEAVEKAVLGEGTPKRLIDAELDRLELASRLGRTEFETKLLALSRFDPDTVLSVLCDLCGVRHYPSFTYEILAHLLKHGFLDAVINFNFDEVLDQAIDDELGPENYVRIVRDGEWTRNLGVNERDDMCFDRPLYVKPHGTVDEPASLRFTREAYFALPSDMARLLNILVSGAPASAFMDPSASDHPSVLRPLCLLVLGHALESFEFNRMMERCPRGSRLYVIAFGNDMGADRVSSWPPIMRDMAKGRFIGIKDELDSLGRMMQKLWSTIETEARDAGLLVRNIARHDLIATLFRPTRRGLFIRTPGQKALELYFEDRFIIELALAIGRAKGFIDLRQIQTGRSGYYYRLLTATRGTKEEHKSVPYYLRSLGMVRCEVYGESYWHRHMVPQEKSSETESKPVSVLTLNPTIFATRTCHDLVERCRQTVSRNRKMKLDYVGGELLSKTLIEMFDGEEVEVSPAQPAQFIFRFKRARPARTVAELKRETTKLLKGRWQVLLSVAESGKWLMDERVNEIARARGGFVGVIVADTIYQTDLNKLSCVQATQLPWHLHNRHMTIALSGNDKALVPNLAIYFERRYRSAHISPVILDTAEDLESVLDDFIVYWLKAERYAAGRSETLNLHPDELASERFRILGELRTRRPANGVCVAK